MRSRLLFAAFALLASAGSARAFDDPNQFLAQATPHAATLSASAEGVYFTGAPRFAGLECAACHAGGPQLLGMQINTDQPDLFQTGYQPGVTYVLEVQLRNERFGTAYNTPTCTEPSPKANPYVPCNNNNFALEIDAVNGPLSGAGAFFCAASPSGGSCPPPDPQNDQVQVAPDGDAVFASRPHDAQNPVTVLRNGATSWRFYFTAPPAGTGPLTLYAAGVDGNGGDGTSDNDQDPAGDDTVREAVNIPEAGAPYTLTAHAACTVAPVRASDARGIALLELVLFASFLRRRRT